MKVYSPPSLFLGWESMHFNLDLAVAKYLASPVRENALCFRLWVRGGGLAG
jgi:hypothetical protein